MSYFRAFWKVGDKWLVLNTDPECNANWVWHTRYYSSDQQKKYIIMGNNFIEY